MQSFIFSPLELQKVSSTWLALESELDVASVTVGSQRTKGIIFAYGPSVLAGYPFVQAVCEQMECEVQWQFPEGTFIDATREKKVNIGAIYGPACRVTQMERTCLEILTRCGACATYARRCVDNAKAKSPNWKGVVCATRKTTPGNWGRLVEKYGAIVGGAYPHRYDLSTLVYLGDNHIAIAGSTSKAVAKARQLCGFSNKIEIECRSTEEALDACKAGADMIMLDHFSPEHCATAAAAIKKQYPHVIVEVGGHITCDTVGYYALPHVDVVSMSAITKGPPPAKIHMKMDKEYVNVAKL